MRLVTLGRAGAAQPPAAGPAPGLHRLWLGLAAGPVAATAGVFLSPSQRPSRAACRPLPGPPAHSELRRDPGPHHSGGGKGPRPFVPGPSHRGSHTQRLSPPSAPQTPRGGVREETGLRVPEEDSLALSSRPARQRLPRGLPTLTPAALCFRMLYPQPAVLTPSRKDVLVLTPWLAPIVWEGTFNIDILNEQFRLQNVTVGLTVFAIKKYVVFLKLFLETAEQHFMVGHRVNYYVFTDRPADMPRVALGEGRRLVLLQVPGAARWQDVSMRRMQMISDFCERRFLREVDFLMCVDVDMRFRDHVGVEILSPLFGTLHPGFYGATRQAFTYERRPQSQAYIPRDQGDFYYLGASSGGRCPRFTGSPRPVTRP
ncbi:LOW QUALITY PROTEIN: hypothetical protein QTO34_005012 [Cnephaeus nilssonii]|uniref:ABO glycosyltransferase n=1 Tax=Cnephaeus nilssonii TaxID=3371016 RepID=A0AA40HMT8_CNENI|nr:LOW QUALITY PROTEIN: hypothetical protein QTO34_005012 [Eptesicus nilssonii]